MNNKQQAIDKITEFLDSDGKGLLITGTNQAKKHMLVMAMIDKLYKNARVLFRINGMQNIADHNFTPLKKQPKAGEVVRLGQNYYEFDSSTTRQTWQKTLHHSFDFAIVYPIDWMCRDGNTEIVEELFLYRKIDKLFLCSWTDRIEYEYSSFSKFYESHIIYDAEEEDPAYHKRVLAIMEGRFPNE